VWGDTLEGGDTRVKAIKSDSDSDSDEQKKVARFFRKFFFLKNLATRQRQTDRHTDRQRQT